MASTRFVLPWPFGPTSAVTPSSSASSADVYDRKSLTERWVTRTSPQPRPSVRLAGARRGTGVHGVRCVDVLGGGAVDLAGTGGRAGRGDGVPAELVAQRGDGLHRRRVLLPRLEAGEQGRADHGHR